MAIITNNFQVTTRPDPHVQRLSDHIIALVQAVRARDRTSEVSASQLVILRHLHRLGSLTAAELATHEAIAPQSVAKTVQLLEESHHVVRAVDPTDRRSSKITLTTLGEKTVEFDRIERAQWLESRMRDRLTDTERALLYLAGDLMEKVASD